MANPISLSGHATQVVTLAQNYAKLIRDVDPNLDDREFLAKALYGAEGLEVPKKAKLRWAFRHLDLYLTDGAIATCVLMRRGPA